MEKTDPDAERERVHSGKTGSSLRDFRFRVPPKPNHPIQYGILKRISDRVLATTSENICVNNPSEEHTPSGSRVDFISTEESLEGNDEEVECVEMKTLCIDKKSVKMPSNDEHKFLKFCGLGLKSWQCPINYTQADFRTAILSIYPRLASVIGFTVWTLTENMKILERIPDEKTTPRQLLEFQQIHCSDILIILPSTNVFLMEEKREYLRQVDSEKSAPTKKLDRYFCLVCGTKESPGYASDFYRIKKDQMPQWTKKQTIEEKLEEILGMNFDQEPILSDRMCPKCFKYISWIDKKEEQLKRSRGLLSNAFRATNSKLNRSHVSPVTERAKPSVLPESLNLSHMRTVETARPTSPGLEESFLTSNRSQPYYSRQNYHFVTSSPSHSIKPSPSPKPSPSTMPSSTYMPTYPGSYSNISTNTNIMNNSNNYTSGYESSYSQSDVNIRSPEPTRKSAIYDSQADSCFESDSNYQTNESSKFYRQRDSSPVDFDKDEKPSLYEENSLKRRQCPDYCWEVINSQDLSGKNLGPLKKRNLSHDRPAELGRAGQSMKRNISYPNM